MAGLSIAVVKDDSVVYARGFGVRDVGTRAPVDEHTVFAIGSMTKLFTAVAAGMMVDSGAMRWDEPLRRHLPTFATADPYATQHLSLRDALSHRSGLDWRLDFVWLGTRKLFKAFTFAFERTEHGWFQVHAYQFSADMGTVIVETREETWLAHGLDKCDAAQSIAFCVKGS